MIKAIIFDCFGVILTDALSALCAELETGEADKVLEMRSIIHAANKGIIAPEESTKRVAELLNLTVEEYRTRIRDGEVRNQKLLDYIVTLRATYKTAMLSNITKQGVERRFPHNELDNYFDVVVVSSEVGYAKPEAEVYTLTAKRLDVEPHACVFIDDRADYVAAAEQIGMRGIVYDTFSQLQRDLTEVIKQA
jgi:HAD superfamily hydrolase (TIGR01509 family)